MLAIANVCELPAPPEFVWPFYTSPAQWPRWSADIERADVDGPMKAGAEGHCKYRMLPEGEFRVVSFDPPHSFTLDWVTLATHVHFQHDLTPTGAHGTHVRERISFSGLLAPSSGCSSARGFAPTGRGRWIASGRSRSMRISKLARRSTRR
jgi:uncharacterized protein YndB with AHSA1/START domain